MTDSVDVSGWTFDEIAAVYGEEAAIQAGIAADPDTWELTEDDFARMRPAPEVDPELGKQYESIRTRLEASRRELLDLVLQRRVVW